MSWMTPGKFCRNLGIGRRTEPVKNLSGHAHRITISYKIAPCDIVCTFNSLYHCTVMVVCSKIQKIVLVDWWALAAMQCNGCVLLDTEKCSSVLVGSCNAMQCRKVSHRAWELRKRVKVFIQSMHLPTLFTNVHFMPETTLRINKYTYKYKYKIYIWICICICICICNLISSGVLLRSISRQSASRKCKWPLRLFWAAFYQNSLAFSLSLSFVIVFCQISRSFSLSSLSFVFYQISLSSLSLTFLTAFYENSLAFFLSSLSLYFMPEQKANKLEWVLIQSFRSRSIQHLHNHLSRDGILLPSSIFVTSLFYSDMLQLLLGCVSITKHLAVL